MKFIRLSLLLLFVYAGSAYAATGLWNFDVVNSSITFNMSHMSIIDISGRFQKFEGKVYTNGGEFDDARFTFTIDALSIYTGNPERDTQFKGNDFFAAYRYPQIKFESISLKKVKGNNYKLTGDLTIRDVTKTVTFDAVYNGTAVDQRGITRAGFKISGEINRFDYNIKYDETLKSGTLLFGKTIEIICNIELINK